MHQYLQYFKINIMYREEEEQTILLVQYLGLKTVKSSIHVYKLLLIQTESNVICEHVIVFVLA